MERERESEAMPNGVDSASLGIGSVSISGICLLESMDEEVKIR